MHWLYKISTILALVLAIVTGGLYAQNCEETYPSGPSQEILISDARGNTLQNLLEIASQYHVTLARVTFESQPKGGNERILTVFETTDDKTLFPANQIYPDYGFNERTKVRHGDALINSLGRWLVYGDALKTAEAVSAIQKSGFKFIQQREISVTLLLKDFFFDSLSGIVIAGMLLICVSAALSASVSSRICAIQSIHGMHQSAIIFRQCARHVIFIMVSTVLGWLAWIAVGAMFWPYASPFGFAGIILLGILLSTAIISASLSAGVILIVRILVPGIIAQIKGQRPLRFLMTIGCFLTVIMLCISTLTFQNSLEKRQQMQHSTETLSHAQVFPDGFQLQLWYTDNDSREAYMPAWDTFLNHSLVTDRIRFSSFEVGCTWTDYSGNPNSTCIIMDPYTAQEQHLIEDTDSLKPVTLIMNTGTSWDEDTLKGSIIATYNFLRELGENPTIGSQTPLSLNKDDIRIISKNSDAQPNAFNAHAGDDQSQAPVIVMNPMLLDGVTAMAMTSTGGMIFTYNSREQIIEELHNDGALDLVASAVKPRDELWTRLQRDIQETAFFTLIAVISFICTIGMGIIISLLLCTIRRRSMFVEFIHGARAYLRFGPVVICSVALCSASLLTLLAAGRCNLVFMAIVFGLFFITVIITHIIYDALLRADSIKHP